MMTLDELWENLRQDPEIKATMEEVDKSYKLFKKIENLIVADLEAKLAESEVIIKGGKEEIKDLHRKINEIVERDMNCIQQLKQRLAEKDGELHQIYSHLGVEAFGEDIHEQALKEIAEKEKEIEELKKGVYKVTLGTTPSNQIDFTENFYVIQNQTAIEELEKVKDFIVKNNEPTKKMTGITRFINQQINDLRGN